MAKTPDLVPYQRVTGAARASLGAQLRERYEAGASIRAICEETGYSIGRVRGLLLGAGAEFRRRGSPTRPAAANGSGADRL